MDLKDSIPPPPEKPQPDECCGSGCVPCIYDYYYKNLAEWEEEHGSLEKNNLTPSAADID